MDTVVVSIPWVKAMTSFFSEQNYSTLAGLEPAISSVGNRRLIH